MKRIAIVIGLFAATPALAVECPTNMPSCKVLFLSPQEESILVQPNGLLDTAALARRVDYDGVVSYFKQKIKDAPQGEPAKPQESK